MTFPEIVKLELAKAREEHAPINSAHEAHSVLLEEVEEFWDEVKERHHDKSAMFKELTQVAAMAQRAAEDLGIDQRAFYAKQLMFRYGITSSDDAGAESSSPDSSSEKSLLSD